MRSQARVERQQEEHRHQRFGALSNVGDRIGRKRMDHPQQGCCKRQIWRDVAPWLHHARQHQRPADEREQQQAHTRWIAMFVMRYVRASSSLAAKFSANVNPATGRPAKGVSRSCVST